MKKLMVLAAFASMMLAGCTSENDDYAKSNEPQKISFTAPVMKGISRVYSPKAGEIETTYPTTEQFKVFGKRYKGTASYPGWDDCLDEYASAGEDALYSESLKGWDTEASHFWIDGYKYAFGAVSPSTVPNATYTAAGVQIANFTPEAIGSQYDLMWAPRVYEKVNLDVTGQDGNPNYNGVTLQFKHALASIQFKIGVHPDNIKVDGQPITAGIFKIKSIKIIGVDGTADFTEGISGDVTAGPTETPAWSNNTATDQTYTFLDKAGSPVNIPALQSASDVKSAMTAITEPAIGGNNAILIPQSLAAAPAKIQVVWTANGNESLPDNVIWYTTDINLSGSWDIGKRYIYNLAFKRNKIYFNPTVENWTDAAESDNVIEK